MPDRYLREALLNSERWNLLSLDARDCYVRLVLIADDHGCYDGRPAIITAQAYRYGRTEALPLAELHRADLIVRYTNAGKPYIAITQWGEVKRGLRKFPAPPVFTDRPEVKYIGIFGRDPSWHNPPRCDAVSVLLDINGKPVVPQPPEWRNKDGSPSGVSSPDHASPESPSPEHSGPMRHRSTTTRAVTGVSGPEAPRSEHSISSQQSTSQPTQPVVLEVVATQPPRTVGPEHPSPTPPPPPPNGEIKLNTEGEWLGLAEAQRLRWQSMFPELAIPDEVERAGQWLLVNVAERAIYERQEDGMRAFLIRWLLKAERERAARTQPARASTDSQGKR